MRNHRRAVSPAAGPVPPGVVLAAPAEIIEERSGDCLTLDQVEALAARLRAAGAPGGTRIYSAARRGLTVRLLAYVQPGSDCLPGMGCRS